MLIRRHCRLHAAHQRLPAQPSRCIRTCRRCRSPASTAVMSNQMTPQQAMDAKAKPPGSLGALERWSCQLAELQGTLQPQLGATSLLLFAADHGITKAEPRVSAYPREVTKAMFGAVARGQAASSVLCAANDVRLLLVDVGVDGDVMQQQPQAFSASTAVETIGVMHCKVASGTAPFITGPAMTPEECAAAMAAGAAAVAAACGSSGMSCSPPGGSGDSAAAATGDKQTARMGAGEPRATAQPLICVGELGLGNTTAAAALLAALSGATAQETCGRGTGVDDAGLRVKQEVVATALQQNHALIQQGPLQALQAVGGLELAAMAGAYLEAGRRGVPAVIDGFISGVAALAAVRIESRTQRCLFASHSSAEQGAQLLLQELGLQPMLQLGLRLGEGTGAVLAVPLLRSAAAVICNMATLQQVMDSSTSSMGPPGNTK